MELELINYELIWGIGFPQGLENKKDIFTLITHVFLIKNGFSCVQPEVEPNPEKQMDVTKLPINWNENHEKFQLVYSYKKNLFTLSLHQVTDGLIQITLVNNSTKTVKNISFTRDAIITVTKGALKEVFPTLETFLLRLRETLIPDDFIDAECTSSSSSNESINVM